MTRGTGSTAALSFGLFFRKAHPISPPVRTAASGCRRIFGKICAQNSALWLVDHHEPDEPGVDHLEEVLVLEGLGGQLEPDGGLAGLRELAH